MELVEKNTDRQFYYQVYAETLTILIGPFRIGRGWGQQYEGPFSTIMALNTQWEQDKCLEGVTDMRICCNVLISPRADAFRELCILIKQRVPSLETFDIMTKYPLPNRLLNMIAGHLVTNIPKLGLYGTNQAPFGLVYSVDPVLPLLPNLVELDISAFPDNQTAWILRSAPNLTTLSMQLLRSGAPLTLREIGGLKQLKSLILCGLYYCPSSCPSWCKSETITEIADSIGELPNFQRMKIELGWCFHNPTSCLEQLFCARALAGMNQIAFDILRLGVEYIGDPSHAPTAPKNARNSLHRNYIIDDGLWDASVNGPSWDLLKRVFSRKNNLPSDLVYQETDWELWLNALIAAKKITDYDMFYFIVAQVPPDKYLKSSYWQKNRLEDERIPRKGDKGHDSTRKRFGGSTLLGTASPGKHMKKQKC